MELLRSQASLKHATPYEKQKSGRMPTFRRQCHRSCARKIIARLPLISKNLGQKKGFASPGKRGNGHAGRVATDVSAKSLSMSP